MTDFIRLILAGKITPEFIEKSRDFWTKFYDNHKSDNGDELLGAMPAILIDQYTTAVGRPADQDAKVYMPIMAMGIFYEILHGEVTENGFCRMFLQILSDRNNTRVANADEVAQIYGIEI